MHFHFRIKFRGSNPRTLDPGFPGRQIPGLLIQDKACRTSGKLKRSEDERPQERKVRKNRGLRNENVRKFKMHNSFRKSWTKDPGICRPGGPGLRVLGLVVQEVLNQESWDLLSRKSWTKGPGICRPGNPGSGILGCVTMVKK